MDPGEGRGVFALAAYVTNETHVEIVQVGDDQLCTLRERGVVVELLLRESRPGSNAWGVARVTLARADDATLSAGGMRDFPYSRCFARATDAVRAARVRQPSPFARPSDPPASFTEDRRGGSPRTERDYALLAAAYVAAGSTPEERADVARNWASRYPGSLATWRNRIARARRYVDSEWLTDEGARLVYGDDLPERIEADFQMEQAERLAHMKTWDHTWRRLELSGRNPASLRAQARAKLGLPAENENKE